MDRKRSRPTPLVASVSILVVAIAAISMILWRTTSVDLLF
jgi:hypothetical protein